MEPKHRFRLYILTALVIVGCGVLMHRLYQFQIVHQKDYLGNIPSTHTVTIYEPGIRGDITDRHGEPLAINIRTYELLLNLKEIHLAWKAEKEKTALQAQPDPTQEKNQKNNEKKDPPISQIVNTWLIPQLQKHGFDTKKRFSRDLDNHYITHLGLVPYRYPVDLTYDQYAQLSENSIFLPGVSLKVNARRKYPYDSLACHILGYLKQWEKNDIPEKFQKPRVHYLGNDKGIAGIEKTLNQQLTGQIGRKQLIRNEKNVVIKLDDYQPPRLGATVQLTIDARIQFLVENTLRKIGRGAAVVQDPNTGEILAMASVPNYNPNHFIPSITRAQKSFYDKNTASPLTNRCLAQFVPGSIYKLPTALAACIHNKTNFTTNCKGFNRYGTTVRIGCWHSGGHGPLGLPEAIQRSCNPYFMDLANAVGAKRIVNTFNLLGLGRKTGVRLDNERPGIVPGSTVWKRENPNHSLSPATLAQVGMGQADCMATPLQINAITSTIANGGRYYQPRIVRRVFHPASGIFPEEVLIENVPIVKEDLMRQGLSEYALHNIKRGMWLAANQKGGTAGTTKLEDILVASKTGTAQTGIPEPSNPDLHWEKNHAWTTSFAPYDSPRYAVTVLVQNGRSGGKVAGSLINHIYRKIFALEAGAHVTVRPMDLYTGNFDPYEEIELPDGDTLPPGFDIVGETGDAISQENLHQPTIIKPNTAPEPTIAPTPDNQ